ncbi:hypothetical protein H632_c68p0, partial [Helicosporidium sp. ATCC 50920]
MHVGCVWILGDGAKEVRNGLGRDGLEDATHYQQAIALINGRLGSDYDLD